MAVYRWFAGLDSGTSRLPDESTILRFRHFLEEFGLTTRVRQFRVGFLGKYSFFSGLGVFWVDFVMARFGSFPIDFGWSFRV
jgi:hypothetical protein